MQNTSFKLLAAEIKKPDPLDGGGSNLEDSVIGIVNVVIKKGKDTIFYGIIGLIICILAVVIVNFVISSVK